MKKMFLLALFILINLNVVFADVVFSEVMYNPSYCSDTKCEWLEIYNNGSIDENLENWTLNGKDFDDLIIKQGEFVVIARNLEGYEEFFGNNDTIWDETDGNYRVIDGSFTLSNVEALVNLTDGFSGEVFYYNDSFGGDGNDRTLQKIDLNGGNFRFNWNESEEENGTPGRFYVQAQTESNLSNSLVISVKVANVAPIIELINITSDDSSDEGIQILPEPGVNKTISFYVDVFDGNGYGDIVEVFALFNGFNVQLDFLESLGAEKARYQGTVLLPFSNEAGIYTINVTVADSFALEDKESVSFEYLRLLSIGLDTNNLDFLSLMPGKESQQKQFSLVNKGNVPINIDILGSDLVSGENVLDSTSMKLISGGEEFIVTKLPKLLFSSLSFTPGMEKALGFSVNVPAAIKADSYKGTLTFIGYGE